MSRLFGEVHRQVQDEQGTRKLADRIEEIACKTEIDADAQAFIESLDMFFLSTVDHNGRPTVSYKGGFAGFVKVIDAQTLIFPIYNGNGMQLSVGNMVANPDIGMLFIAFDKPHRIRLQGVSAVSRDPQLLSLYKEAEFVVKVTLSELWQNCPRYIHRYTRESSSRYVPSEQCQTPLAEWKRFEFMQDVLSDSDAKKAKESGFILVEDWVEKIKAGAPDV
jgi:predicted pyridoxine 5'-phosphate oxidase superfamily flavin-nucleotide-binding protein